MSTLHDPQHRSTGTATRALSVASEPLVLLGSAVLLFVIVMVTLQG